MWLGNDDGCVSQARLPKTSTGSQPIVTLVISLDQSIGQNTRTSGQASLAQRSSMSHELASTNPHASSSARKHLPQPRFSNPSQYTASEIRQQQSGGTTPIAGLGHTSAINHSPSYDDQPEHTVEYSLDIMSTQLSPHSTAFARAGGQQHMPLHPGPMSMQNQAGSAKQPCQLAHDGPVLEIMVISNRVVTRGGREHTLIMKEWTPKGELVGTHPACKQGRYMYKLTLRDLLSCLLPLCTVCSRCFAMSLQQKHEPLPHAAMMGAIYIDLTCSDSGCFCVCRSNHLHDCPSSARFTVQA